MIFGAHVIVYSKDAAADRAFLRDILGLASVDAGHGWLIFALPPAEVRSLRPRRVSGTSSISCVTIWRLRNWRSVRRASGVRRPSRPGGVRSPRSGFPAEVKWVSINPSIPWRSPARPTYPLAILRKG